MLRSRSQAPANPRTGVSVMVSEYQLHWRAIFRKAKLETLLECRQYWLTEQPAVQHLVLKAGTAMSAETDNQPQTWLLQSCVTSTEPGGTWQGRRGVSRHRWAHRNLLAADTAQSLLLSRQRHLLHGWRRGPFRLLCPVGSDWDPCSTPISIHEWKPRKWNIPELAGSVA